MSEVIEEKTTGAAAAPRDVPVIDPGNVKANTEGFEWSEWRVRLPRGATLQDLNHPSLWRLVQGSRSALRRLDRVQILSFDEEWVAEAIVAGATRGGVTLSKPSVTRLPPRTEVLAGDDTYQIRWAGNGYVVERRRDGHAMTNPVQTVHQAERDLKALYPEPVTGRLA